MPVTRESSPNYHVMALFVYQLMDARRGRNVVVSYVRKCVCETVELVSSVNTAVQYKVFTIEEGRAASKSPH
jgi:hypothetical protein